MRQLKPRFRSFGFIDIKFVSKSTCKSCWKIISIDVNDKQNEITLTIQLELNNQLPKNLRWPGLVVLKAHLSTYIQRVVIFTFYLGKILATILGKKCGSLSTIAGP